MSDQKRSEFEKAAAAGGKGGNFAQELWEFLKTNKKWWMLPVLIVFLLLALLVLISSTGLAPFIYTIW